MRFVHLNNILVLTLILILWLAYFFYVIYKLRKVKILSESYKFLDKIRNFKSVNIGVRTTIQIFITGFIVFLNTMMVLRPISGSEQVQGFTTNLDVAFIVDTSLSMSANDFQNDASKSRLDGAKEVIQGIILSRSDRYALMSFSHKAFIECPLTFDKNTVQTGIDTLTIIKSYHARGTSFVEAFEEARERLVNDKDPLAKSRKKIIIFISDGEPIGETKSDLSEAIRNLTSEGISIFTVGVGTKEGARIIDYVSSTGEIFYKRYNGKDVISKLEDSTLKDIAQKGSGLYFQADSQTIPNLSTELEKQIEDGKITNDQTIYKELYFLISPCILILFLVFNFEIYSPFIKKRKNTNVVESFKLRAVSPVLLVLFLPIFILLFNIHLYIGNSHFSKSKFQDASSSFLNATNTSVDFLGVAYHNLGSSYYRQNRYEDAINSYRNAISYAESFKYKPFLCIYNYNLGNAYYKYGFTLIESDPSKTIESWENAILAYQNSLSYCPEDKEVIENLEFVKNLLENLKNDPQEGEKEGDDEKEGDSEKEKMKDDTDRVEEDEKKNKESFNENRKYVEDEDSSTEEYEYYDGPSW